MICPYCKSELPDGSQFCSKCGQTIAHQDNQNSASSTYWSAVEKEVARDDKIRIDAENKIIAKQKKKNRTVIVSLITLAIIAIAIFYVVSIYPKQQFNTADRLLENGEYHEAMAIYEKLGNYKNASEQIAKCQEGITEQQYLSGVSEFQKENYEIALNIFEELGNYKDCESLQYDCNLQIAQSFVPAYYWDFTSSLSEKNGTASTPYGNTAIVDVKNANIGQAAYFDGDGDYIECGRDINLTEDFTLNFLLCCQDVYKDYSAFFAKFENNGGPYAFSINQGHINCWITNEDGYHVEIESITDIKNSEWYFISIVKSDENFQLYINGRLDSQDTITSVYQGEDLVTIGRQALMFPPEDQLQFCGYIGEIAIYENAFTDDEISALFALKKKILETDETSNNIYDSEEIDTRSPFNQEYWVIFTEGFREDRVEASSINSSLAQDSIYIIWDSALYLSDSSGSDNCDQYYLDENDEWCQIGSYSRFTDNATHIIASNLDIYDINGNLVLPKCSYVDIDWNKINSFR